ncbi:MAG: exonuclease SbcCD subunit D C-terminal domain-containing protein [Candidatus Cloacimonetes bacterium]|nr:exonuclease SbcCD subunit D C-terminal domain-containing protein [Candidatus Cloacimonadota bacterium]
MKVLHTSDWHLGRALYGRKRYEEFELFLSWLAETIRRESVDILLLSGDVFDSSLPSNRAQELYYRFLSTATSTGCRHIVIIAGNHDSPTFLNAPGELLKALNIHVVSGISDDPEDEIKLLKDAQGKPEAVVCAVPFLRDSDIRKVETGESVEDKQTRLLEGIAGHYEEVGKIAKKLQQAEIPVIGMGHLFTAGGKTLADDGVRELYVGSLAHVNSNIFPKCFNYVALGHLHVPQQVAGNDYIRYSGSPLPIGFGEAEQQKQVVMIEFEQRETRISEIAVPCFQKLQRIKGDMEKIIAELEMLKAKESNAWLEIEYTGSRIAENLRQAVEEATADSNLEVLRIINKPLIDSVISSSNEDETLDDLETEDVFIRCLDAHDIGQEEREELLKSYREIVSGLQEEDINAE